MSFIRGGETITIRRRSQNSVDDYGNATWSTTNIVVKDALVAVLTGEEPADVARDHVDASLTLYLPNGTEVKDGDVFVIRNSTWVKDGSVQNWVSPFIGLQTGVVVPVKRRNG